MRSIKKIMCISISCTLLFTGCLKDEQLYQSYKTDNNTSNNVYNESETISSVSVMTSKQYLFSATCLEYNMMVPYVQGGSAEERLKKYDKGIQEEDLKDEYFHGVDSEGYVKWLYAKIFNTDIIVGTLFSYLENCTKIVDFSTLQIGDICSIEDSTNANLYGVVAYINEDGTVIVSLCDSSPNEKFVTGSVRLAYIQSQKNSYYENSMPVNFNVFYRPNVKWGS